MKKMCWKVACNLLDHFVIHTASGQYTTRQIMLVPPAITEPVKKHGDNSLLPNKCIENPVLITLRNIFTNIWIMACSKLLVNTCPCNAQLVKNQTE